jgi:hypothetical protein
MSHDDALDALLTEVLDGGMTLEEACSRAARLPLTPQLREQLSSFQQAVDRMEYDSPQLQYAIARLCACVAARFPESDALRTSMLWSRELSEAEIFRHLQSLIRCCENPQPDAERVLKDYELERNDVFPMRPLHEWAAFSVVS